MLQRTRYIIEGRRLALGSHYKTDQADFTDLNVLPTFQPHSRNQL